MTFPLFAFYVGNPADPAIMNMGFFSTSYPIFKFTSGYIYDHTSNKKYVAPDQTLQQFGLHSQLASFSLIFVERLQIFGTAGGSKEIVKEKSIYESLFDIHTNYHFSWSAGAKLILFQWGPVYLSSDFTFFEVPSSPKSFFRYLNRMNLTFDEEKQKFSLREWQLSSALSAKLFFLSPYAGVSYLKSKLHAGINYHNALNWGYFYGLTLSLTGRFHLNFEKRFRDEYGYTLATILVF